MACGNPPEESTPPQQHVDAAYRAQLITPPSAEALAKVEAALDQVRQERTERQAKTMDLRDHFSVKPARRDDQPLSSSRGLPRVDISALLEHPGHLQYPTPGAKRWKEVGEDGEHIDHDNELHSHIPAEAKAVVLSGANGPVIGVILIPRDAATRNALFGWSGRAEGGRE